MTPDYPLPILGFIGVLVSMYIMYVEYNMEKSASYKPMCDIESVGVSCSRVFGSEAGHMLSYFGLVPRHSLLDLSNGQGGLLFYCFQLLWPNLTVIPRRHRARIQMLASLGSIVVSLLLGYVMLTELHEVCLVCSVIHLINLFILIFSVRWIAMGGKTSSGKKIKSM